MKQTYFSMQQRLLWPEWEVGEVEGARFCAVDRGILVPLSTFLEQIQRADGVPDAHIGWADFRRALTQICRVMGWELICHDESDESLAIFANSTDLPTLGNGEEIE